MKVLLIGGSGIVGTLITPFLSASHDLKVFDLTPPENSDFDFYKGDVTNYDDLVAAADGMDAVAYLAMGNLQWKETTGVVTAYDVNIKGVHLALRAAHEVGITQAVYASSMSVYAGDLNLRYFADESLTPDSSELYGFTKFMGELVCQNATRQWGMNVNALRLCLPTLEEKWLENTVLGKPTIATTGRDVALALDAALKFSAGFQAFMISGDYENKLMNMSKAKRLLGWEPQARPVKQVQ